MEINKDKLAQLGNLDDDVLKDIIRQVIKAAGGNSLYAEMAANNTKQIKAKLQSANPAEIEQIINIVGKDKAAEILNNIEVK
ncbi:MAG: hypothetical protein FWB93_05545 [Oscillospiraceae bacterium]|nr:hypothetical protein [Oscillospiraceae bacterium]